MKRKFFFIIFLLLSKENVFSMSLVTSILQGDRHLNKEEYKFVQSFSKDYDKCLSNRESYKIEDFFFEKKINISIEYNNVYSKYDDEKTYMGEILNINDFENIYGDFINFVGNLEKIQILEAFFSKQPYGYPIENIFYIRIEKIYSKITTQEILIISKDTEKVYEHIIYIPKK